VNPAIIRHLDRRRHSTETVTTGGEDAMAKALKKSRKRSAGTSADLSPRRKQVDKVKGGGKTKGKEMEDSLEKLQNSLS
jgi:hypothetical protein